jgi:hypothetical protein
MDNQITTLSKDQVRTNLQGLIDSGELKGIRSDGVNTNQISVDTLSRPADPRVNREIEVVNDFQSRQGSPTLSRDIQNAIATPAPELTPETGRDALAELQREIQGADVVADRRQVREDLQISQKEERARNLSNQLVQRQRDIDREIERMEKNPEGQSRAGLNATLNTYRRESARELADLSFSYNVALGDYQAAEKIANDYMDDITQELQLKQQSFNNLFQLVQNDMTQSEQLQAQQAFAEKQSQTSFEQQQKMAQFQSTLRKEEIQFAESIKPRTTPSSFLDNYFGHQADPATNMTYDEFVQSEEANEIISEWQDANLMSISEQERNKILQEEWQSRQINKQHDTAASFANVPVENIQRLETLNLEPAQIENVMGIINGNIPPLSPSAVRSEFNQGINAGLNALGYDLTRANQDWMSMNRRLATMNSASFVRLETAITNLQGSVPQAERLFREWQQTGLPGGFSTFNKAALEVAARLPGEAGAAARTLQSHIEDMANELSVVYRGGGTPTDKALESAQKSLSADWNDLTFFKNTALIRENLQIRQNSLSNASGIPGNIYNPADRNPEPVAPTPVDLSDLNWKI